MDYWTVHSEIAGRVGYMCRECHHYINKGEPMIERDGRKIRLRYHKSCFSGTADPRTQKGSSFNSGRMPANCFQPAAPKFKY